MGTPLAKTPLAPLHTELGARMIEFAGWSMPLCYSSVMEEHNAVRSTAGLFDVSHMGSIRVSGTGCEAWVNTMLTNDIRLLSEGFGQYSLILNEKGTVVDDLIVFRLEDKLFLFIVNASRIREAMTWLQKKQTTYVHVEDVSALYCALALQGPIAEEILREVFSEKKWVLRRNQISPFEWEEAVALTARTGYTGEDGFEIFLPPEQAPSLWQRILEVGRDLGARPAGLGARDTLRMEMGYPLYGHEIDENVTPLEAGLSFALSFDKPERFNGRKNLEALREKGVQRKLICFKYVDTGPPPRQGYTVYDGNVHAGVVTSGCISPMLHTGIGMAYVNPQSATPGTKIQIEIRGCRVSAEVVKKPIYNKR